MPERHDRSAEDRWLCVSGVIMGLLMLGLLAGCGQDARSVTPGTATSVPGTSASAARTPTAAPVAAPARFTSPSPIASPSADVLVARVAADAAQRANVGQGDVRIVLVEAREWPDRSLGCPRPGVGYAQAITPGYRIVAEAGGQRLVYHTDSSQVVLCDA